MQYQRNQSMICTQNLMFNDLDINVQFLRVENVKKCFFVKMF